jgi:hypothetical protein
MGRDMALALGSATTTGSTILGLNQFGGESTTLRYLPRREHAAGEQVNHPRAVLPEVRQAAAVLGAQPSGSWGLAHGCNEHGLFLGRSAWHSRLAGSSDPSRAVDGYDLVRLVLERSQSACQALDLLTEAIERHGQSGPGGDSVFLVADAREAFVVEAAGNHWGLHVCHATRAVCDVGLVRQDWHRLSRGLGAMVLDRKWWPGDGTKLDFHDSLLEPGADEREGLRRWSRATLALAQQEGAIDAASMRRMLAEHFEQCGERAAEPVPTEGPGTRPEWRGSWIVSLSSDRPPLVWSADGSIGVPLYFPLVVGVPLPQMLLDGPALPMGAELRGPDRATADLPALCDRLQAEFDQEIEATSGKSQSRERYLDAGQAWMNRHAELWLAALRGYPTTSSRSDANPLAFINE